MNPKLEVLAGARDGWFTRSDAAHAGYSDSEIRQRLKCGQWTRLCRDAYVESGAWPDGELPWDRAIRLHKVLTRVVLSRMTSAVAVSHQSAAILHGLPGWGSDLSRVQVTRSTGRTRSDRVTQTHRSPLSPGDTTVVDGLQVTGVARCIVETTCLSSYEAGVVLSDAALRAGLVDQDELIAAADRLKHWPGSPAAGAATRFADGRSESVGESRLRVLMANQGLPAPTLQAEIRDPDGHLLGRVDFLLDRVLIVEFDGAQKYSTDGANVLVAEKWREDRIRELGYSFARFGWADLAHPTRTANRIRRALTHAAAA
ncbi:type IV toxin-antitoxin system AbiEi family antitoxin domain-containing protein [Kribbella caucasensis]|nr:type IV toxin-antitoxin system AbiEi family antitoxin domain-containing protein [Kribbella sp. VKM Ac-2527]